MIRISELRFLPAHFRRRSTLLLDGMFQDPPSTKHAIVAYLIASVAVGAFAWIGAQFEGSVFWPVPLIMVLPAWLLGETLFGNIDAGPKLIPLIGSLPFIIVGIPLLLPKSRVMWPTVALCLTLATASVVYFAMSWSRGLEYQGNQIYRRCGHD